MTGGAADPATASPATAGGGHRAYGFAVLVGLLSAVAVTTGVSRPWYEASATVKNLPRLEAAATGSELLPVAGALGLVLMASFGAVIATRGWWRRGLGLLIVVGAVVVLVAAARPGTTDQVLRADLAARGWPGGGYDTSVTPWRWLVLAGSAGCLAAGAAVARFGAQWPTMGQRYDAPPLSADSAAADESFPAEVDRSLTQEQLWRALDQGRDPTQRP